MGRRFAVAAAVTALLFTTVGCTSTIPGNAVASEAGLANNGVTVSADGFGVALGTSEDVAIDLFIEPQCPHCAKFFDDYGQSLTDYTADGDVTVTIRPVTFLDGGSIDYSARTSNAIFLVAEGRRATPEQVMEFIRAGYAEIMSTGTPLDDDELAQLANDVGADANTVNRVAAGEPAIDPDEMSNENIALMRQYGVPAATPTVYDTLTETDVDTTDPRWLDDLVDR